MQYTDEAAKRLQAKYNIPVATLRTWAHRGKIPDRYFKDDGSPADRALTPEQKDDLKSIARGLSYRKIRVAALSRVCGISYFRLKDALRGKSSLLPGEFLKLKKKYNNLRSEVKKSLAELERTRTPSPSAENTFRNLLDNDLLVVNTLFDRNDDVRVKIDGWRRGMRSTFPTEILNEIKAGLIVFLAETGL